FDKQTKKRRFIQGKSEMDATTVGEIFFKNWPRGVADLKKPYFLWLHYSDPHEPYEEREEFYQKLNKVPQSLALPKPSGTRRERNWAYAREIYYTDYYINQFLKKFFRKPAD